MKGATPLPRGLNGQPIYDRDNVARHREWKEKWDAYQEARLLGGLVSMKPKADYVKRVA